MPLQSPFFNHKRTDQTNVVQPTTAAGPSTLVNGRPPGYVADTRSAPANPKTGVAEFDIGLGPAHDATSKEGKSSENKLGESRLTVGPNIKLKGVEITDCDTLVVEGSVEATMDSRVIQIAERGSFKGSAEIDIAEIRGTFDGKLTVRNKLMIYATGKVSGQIHYGKVVIEEGGQLSGEIQFAQERASERAA